MSKKSIILLIIVILLIFAGWEFYWLSNRHYVQKIKNNTFAFIPTTTPINTFNSSLILKKIEFIDSTGKNKVLIAVKTGEGHTSIPVVDTYIADDNLSQTSAVKISILSGKDSLLNYPIADPQSVLISISPGPGKKFIVISSSEEEVGSFMTLIDENGHVISNEVADTVFPLVKDICQCGFEFGTWKDQNKFYVVIPSAKGTYRVLIDAKTGKPIGTYEEIK